MLSKISKKTESSTEMVDVTAEIAEIVKGSNVKDGVVVVSSPHTTCGITVNENTDPGLKKDILNALASHFPKGDAKYTHRGGNADAHIKTALVGTSVTLLIEDRALNLGRWQSVYLCEFDGPRDRELRVKILAG